MYIDRMIALIRKAVAVLTIISSARVDNPVGPFCPESARPINTTQQLGTRSRQGNRRAFADHMIQVLSGVVKDAECFTLESGSIEATCDLIESLVAP